MGVRGPYCFCSAGPTGNLALSTGAKGVRMSREYFPVLQENLIADRSDNHQMKGQVLT